MYYGWLVGILLSLAASLFGTIGKVMMKLTHKRDGNHLLFAGAFVCVIILNPVFDAWSYSFAAQSVLAPMAGFSVVWNIVLSPFILKEKLSDQVIQGSSIILIGCGLVSMSGDHASPTHTPEQLYALFSETIFVVYASVSLASCAMLIFVVQTFPHSSYTRRFAFGALAGLVGGNLYFMKTSVELIGNGGPVWSNVGTYFIFAGALGCAAGGIYVLNLGLKEYDALYVVAIYESFLILCGMLLVFPFF
ncbi:NIPA-like protein 3 [Aphanomyces cochlioides]|nr:NIPA-like protein 3 [Aphanomyces cochlioides]